MNGIFVDSCVLLDLFTADPRWAGWSEAMLERHSLSNSLYINAVVYAEISIGFNQIETVDRALAELNIKVLEIPKEALFLAGKIFLQYRKNKGAKRSPLPDFFIGAQALVTELALLTRDESIYRTYFPQLHLICPSDEPNAPLLQ